MWIQAAVLTLSLSGLLAGQQTREEKKKADDEAKAKIAEFKKELRKCKTNDDVGRAIGGLAQVQHPKILAELKRWLSRPQADIAGVAADMIGKYKNDRVASETLAQAALSRKDKETIIRCLRGIAEIGYRPIVPKLLKLFRHKDVDVVAEVVDTCGQLRSKLAIDSLIKLYKELEGIQDNSTEGGGLGAGLGGVANERLDRKRALTSPTENALIRITDQKHKTVREWDTWWRRNKRSFKELED